MKIKTYEDFKDDFAARRKKIIDLYKTGDWTMAEIGEKFGMSRSRVSQIVDLKRRKK